MPAAITLWSLKRDQELQQLWEATPRLSTAKIAQMLGTTKSAVIGRAHRTNLTPRASPIIRGTEAKPQPVRRCVSEAALPPVKSPNEDQIAGIIRMETQGYRCEVIATSMNIELRAVRKVCADRPKPALPPLPVASPPRPRPVYVPPPVVRGESKALAAHPVRQCEYLNGSTPKTFIRCEHSALAGKSWCQEHAARVFVPIRSRQDDAA